MTSLKTNKEIILDCALELFSKKGYEAVSVQEIVNVAHITKPTLYYYYKSKKGLFEQLLLTYYSILDNLLKDVCKYKPKTDFYYEDIYPILVNVTNSYFTFAKNNPLFYRIILANQYMPQSASTYDIVSKYHYNQHNLLLNMFSSMAKIHTNLKNKDHQLTYSFLGIINIYIGLYLSGKNKEISTSLAKELVHQFMHGIYA